MLVHMLVNEIQLTAENSVMISDEVLLWSICQKRREESQLDGVPFLVKGSMARTAVRSMPW